ncbi:MAG: putative ferrous iron transport protein C [Thiomicrorhabdus sp.]|nr:MAG: putative ferrous iron transport protein C [Thiomicrorhabdus sp.]
MILLDLKKYIKRYQQVSLINIKNHFDLTEDAALGLIEPLIVQGFIQSLEHGECSSGQCTTSCAQKSHGMTYLWIGKPLKKLNVPVEII